MISLPGCIAEAVPDDDDEADGEGNKNASVKEKEPRKSRVPSGYYGLRCVCAWRRSGAFVDWLDLARFETALLSRHERQTSRRSRCPVAFSFRAARHSRVRGLLVYFDSLVILTVSAACSFRSVHSLAYPLGLGLFLTSLVAPKLAYITRESTVSVE